MYFKSLDVKNADLTSSQLNQTVNVYIRQDGLGSSTRSIDMQSILDIIQLDENEADIC